MRALPCISSCWSMFCRQKHVPHVHKCCSSEVRRSERVQRSGCRITTWWNGGGGVKPGCVPPWPCVWHNTHSRSGPISAPFTRRLKTQTLGLSRWNWLDTMKPRKEKTAEWGAFWKALSVSFSRSFLLHSLPYFFSPRLGGPTESERHCHEIRHDCIVMLSDCANVQSAAQICVIHQTLISSSSSYDVFYGKNSQTQMCSLPCRRGTRWRRFSMILASRASLAALACALPFPPSSAAPAESNITPVVCQVLKQQATASGNYLAY